MWVDYQLFNETLSSTPAKVNFERHTRKRVIPSHSHSGTCVFESTENFPPNIPKGSHSTQLNLFEDNVAVLLCSEAEVMIEAEEATRT